MQHTKPKDRVLSIDCMRGAAMILILFAHTRPLLDQTSLSQATWTILYYSTNISTVAFAFVNGVMLSYFFSGPKKWSTVYQRFAKRALLLFACHPFIKVISYPSRADEGSFWHYMFTDFPITDTIALCLLITPWITRFTTPKLRLTIMGTLLIVSPAVVGYAANASGIGELAVHFFFGTLSWTQPDVMFPFPLLPWIAIDLCGSFLGKQLAQIHHQNATADACVARTKRLGLQLLPLFALLATGYKVLKSSFGGMISDPYWEAYYPSKTTALLPLYIAALLLCFQALYKCIDMQKNYPRAAWFTSVLGRTSLFTYLTEFVVVMTIPSLLGLKGNLLVPNFFLVFLMGTSVCWIASYRYGLWRGWISPNDYEDIKALQSLQDAEAGLPRAA